MRKYWYLSKEMIKTDNKIKTLYQKRSHQLKQSHTILANEILKLGTDIIAKDMQWPALAKKARQTENLKRQANTKRKSIIKNYC